MLKIGYVSLLFSNYFWPNLGNELTTMEPYLFYFLLSPIYFDANSTLLSLLSLMLFELTI